MTISSLVTHTPMAPALSRSPWPPFQPLGKNRLLISSRHHRHGTNIFKFLRGSILKPSDPPNLCCLESLWFVSQPSQNAFPRSIPAIPSHQCCFTPLQRREDLAPLHHGTSAFRIRAYHRSTIYSATTIHTHKIAFPLCAKDGHCLSLH